MLHQIIVRRDDLIEGTDDSLAGCGTNENGRTLSRSAALNSTYRQQKMQRIYRRIVRLRFIVS
jgi:hypothetical protein